MNPVDTMTPEAKARTKRNNFLSGPRAGTALENKGRDTPTILATNMVPMAM